ncbi:hypothetical protein ACHAWF_001746 [Thalassiosira exigua]
MFSMWLFEIRNSFSQLIPTPISDNPAPPRPDDDDSTDDDGRREELRRGDVRLRLRLRDRGRGRRPPRAGGTLDLLLLLPLRPQRPRLPPPGPQPQALDPPVVVDVPLLLPLGVARGDVPPRLRGHFYIDAEGGPADRASDEPPRSRRGDGGEVVREGRFDPDLAKRPGDGRLDAGAAGRRDGPSHRDVSEPAELDAGAVLQPAAEAVRRGRVLRAGSAHRHEPHDDQRRGDIEEGESEREGVGGDDGLLNGRMRAEVNRLLPSRTVRPPPLPQNSFFGVCEDYLQSAYLFVDLEVESRRIDSAPPKIRLTTICGGRFRASSFWCIDAPQRHRGGRISPRRPPSPQKSLNVVHLALSMFHITHVLFYCSRQWGVPEIHVLSVVASKKGLSELMKYHPDVRVTVGRVDEELDADGDLVPGLGDAGDRLFGTPLIDDEEELVHPSKRKRTMSVDVGNGDGK